MSDKNELAQIDVEIMSNLPVLPLRDVVVYTHMVIPLFVGREKSIAALEAAMLDNKQIFLVSQRKSANDDPHPNDLYDVGTVSSLLQLLRLPDGTVKVLVEGERRAKVVTYSVEKNGYIAASLEPSEDINNAMKKQDIEIIGFFAAILRGDNASPLLINAKI